MARYDARHARGPTRFKHRAEYALLRATVAALRGLPPGAALWIARRLGDAAFDVVRLRRRVTLDNLQRALGAERSARELRAIARDCYRHFAMTFVELVLWPHRPPGELEACVEILHPEYPRAAAAAGRGVLYLTAHFGNWELLGARMSRLESDLHIVAGDQRNELVDRFVRRQRERLGMQVIPMATAVRDVLRALRRGGSAALVADQDGGRDGVFLDFFGRPAAHFAGPARLACRAGAPVVMGFCRRVGAGRFEAEFCAPIHPDPSRGEDEEIVRILTAYRDALSRVVRANPEQWFWMHRRWKSQPPAPGA